MNITGIRIMRGPSIWSVQHPKLIVLTVDIAELMAMNAHQRQAYLNKISNSFTWLSFQDNCPEMIEKLITGLLFATGMPCHYSRSEMIKDNACRVIYSYTNEEVAKQAGEFAIQICSGILNDQPVNSDQLLDELHQLARRHELGATSSYILQEVEKRNIPYKRFHNSSLIMLGYGQRQKMMRTAVTDTTSGLGIEMAGDKEETKQLLAEAHVPVPKGLLLGSEDEFMQALEAIQFPIVVKPLDGNHGRGVTTNIQNKEQAMFGYGIAQKISDTVIIEEFVEGDDYRFLLVDFKLVAVAKRTPARVTGNGKLSIRELVEEANTNPERGTGSGHVLSLITIDAVTENILSEKNLSPESILPEGETLVLKETANISSGGTASDVTDKVHPFTVFMVERIARLFKLNICGVDIIMKDISAPLSRENGAVIEVNAGPGIRMHTNPQDGTPRNVAAPILDMLFPNAADARIPIVAVTGTNGKTTTTRLIAHLATAAGYSTGYTTTEGIYIKNNLLKEGDCSGPVSASTVLFDPTVNFAVLECARGGILRAGLGFDYCNVSVITNVSEDHIGLDDINTLDDMLRVKSVLAHATDPDGYVVLNADDDLVYSLYHQLQSNIALFSLDPENPRILKHLEQNGLAAVMQNGYFVIYDGRKILVEQDSLVPITYDGNAEYMMKNVLAAILATYVCKIGVEFIREGCRSFFPSAEQTPGRMNLFNFGHCRLMVDYAHNVNGFSEAGKYISKVAATKKTGIIGVAGDRRDQDIDAIGRLCAGVFDEIIIRFDTDLRGRKKESTEQLLRNAIAEVKPGLPVTVIDNEEDAIRYALQVAPEGSFIFAAAEKVHHVLKFVQQLQTEFTS